MDGLENTKKSVTNLSSILDDVALKEDWFAAILSSVSVGLQLLSSYNIPIYVVEMHRALLQILASINIIEKIMADNYSVSPSEVEKANKQSQMIYDAIDRIRQSSLAKNQPSVTKDGNTISVFDESMIHFVETLTIFYPIWILVASPQEVVATLRNIRAAAADPNVLVMMPDSERLANLVSAIDRALFDISNISLQLTKWIEV
jgi:hypothetical protein